MAHLQLETTINAPIGAVFDLLQAIERGPEWMADLQEVHNVTGHQVGDSSAWTFKMLGRPFTGQTYIRHLAPRDAT